MNIFDRVADRAGRVVGKATDALHRDFIADTKSDDEPPTNGYTTQHSFTVHKPAECGLCNAATIEHTPPIGVSRITDRVIRRPEHLSNA